MRDSDAPSWFNAAEVTRVVEYVNILLENGVHPTEIGVIAPYCKQVEKIRESVKGSKGSDIIVGTMEAFQGLEMRAVILSTVRSTAANDILDKRHLLGFLSDPKRLCVALSRATELLIIVGNAPLFASADALWHRFLSLLVEMKVYIGPPLPPLSTQRGFTIT